METQTTYLKFAVFEKILKTFWWYFDFTGFIISYSKPIFPGKIKPFPTNQVYSEPHKISEMGLLSYILDARQGSDYASAAQRVFTCSNLTIETL